MELYPAIDLRGGAAVRLTQGDFDRQVGYGDPLDVAQRFIAAGARWLHVVDLEAARTGTAHEGAALERIVAVASSRQVSVQTGGGIRTEAIAAATLARGLARVVLGTAALEDPALADRCARRWPGQVAVGLDYAGDGDGVVQAMGHGWREGAALSSTDLLARWEGAPFAAVVATSIARDGMLDGPDLAGLRSLLGTTAIPVIASGGVGSLDDLAALAALSAGPRRLAGVIVGKALVEGRFSVEEALAACGPSA
jgi:phosphoribosylformimino-5-aminoimidazole carboxamide ribotide isomerase